MICPNCGTDAGSSKFCTNCGTPLQQPSQQPQQTAQQPVQPQQPQQTVQQPVQPQQTVQQPVQQPAQPQQTQQYVPPVYAQQPAQQYQQPQYQQRPAYQQPQQQYRPAQPAYQNYAQPQQQYSAPQNGGYNVNPYSAQYNTQAYTNQVYSGEGAVVEDFNLFTAYGSMFKKFAKFSGRSRRKEYWLANIMNAIIMMIFSIVFNILAAPYVEPLTAKEERDSFLLMHPKKKCNGITYVTAREGDTYANVAFRLNVRERDLREDNDALGRELQKGDRIYLSAKKNTSTNTYVWTHTGQSLWQLSQEEGVSIEAIRKYNELDPQIRTFRTRQKIYLRKVKDDGSVR